jgi:hypothetical protein
MLTTLERHDPATANAILAAAVLSTATNPGLADDLQRAASYEGDVRLVLDEVRSKLRVERADESSRTKARIVDFLSSAIDRQVFGPGQKIDATLQRVGQLGLLSPSAYTVQQPESFKQRFYSLTFNKRLVREVINEPDEVQHLMTENALDNDEKDALSLFLKKAVSNKNEAHWLLIQTVRIGMTQVAQSAWRVFPADVDLSKVEDPKGVLRAFVDVFGLNVRVGGTESKFIDVVQYPTGSIQMGMEQRVGVEAFYSWSSRSHTKLENISEIGIAYGINLQAYRAALQSHGYSAPRPPRPF